MLPILDSLAEGSVGLPEFVQSRKLERLSLSLNLMQWDGEASLAWLMVCGSVVDWLTTS